MEFHQLTLFVTVARTGNVTRAAAEFNTTPPVVSTHIRQLEEELRLSPVTRTSKGMRRTSEGERMEKLNSWDLKELAALPWIFPTHPCPFLDTVKSFLETNDIELENRLFANDDITKYTFIEQEVAVSILEKNEAAGFAKKRNVFLWPGEEKFKTILSLAYSRERAGDRLIRTVTDCLIKTWNIG